jgi:hypothetical protein
MGMSQFQVELLKKLPREPEAPITLQELALRLARNWDQTRSETGASAEISDASKRKRVANNLDTVLALHPSSLERTTHPKNKRQYLYRLKATAPMMLMPMSQEQMMAFETTAGILQQTVASWKAAAQEKKGIPSMNMQQRRRIEEMLVAAMTSGLAHKGAEYRMPESMAIEYGRICYNLAIQDTLQMLKSLEYGSVGVDIAETISDLHMTQKVTL